tara:strand:+ start:391 stop:633 length:243 start_codon:yes stop_codon:yes gene_type:complete
LKGLERVAHLAWLANSEVDVIPLQDATAHVGLVGVASAQPFYGCGWIAEGFQERKREIVGIKRLAGQFRNRGFDLYGIHN